MGLYVKYVLPRLINLAMGNKDMTRLRAESIPRARGHVLEIGIGSGLNLQFYPSAVHHVYDIDPSIELQQPNGSLIFIEHGRSADAGVTIWQDRMTPIWKRIGGGCHLNRKIDELIRSAGFHITEQTNFYLPGPRPMTYTYQGIATLA